MEKPEENQEPASQGDSPSVDKSWLDAEKQQPENGSGINGLGVLGDSALPAASDAQKAGNQSQHAQVPDSQGAAGLRVVDRKKPTENVFPHRENAPKRGIKSLNAVQMAQFSDHWRAGSLTVGQLATAFELSRDDVLVLGARVGARGAREEFRARLGAALIDPEGAAGAAAAAGAGLDFLPRDGQAAIARAVANAVGVVEVHKGAAASAREVAQALVRAMHEASAVLDEVREWATIAAEVRAGLRDRDGNPVEEPRRGADARFRQALEGFEAVISIHAQAQTIDKLASALAKLVQVERKSWGIADDDGGGAGKSGVPLEERLRQYAAAGGIDPSQAA